VDREPRSWLRILLGNSKRQDLHRLGLEFGERSKLVHYGYVDREPGPWFRILPGSSKRQDLHGLGVEFGESSKLVH
jgi:hypothetical protein